MVFLSHEQIGLSMICPYSSLPYTCPLCPEDNAPCYYMQKKRGDAVSTASPQLCNSSNNELPNSKSDNPDCQVGEVSPNPTC